jgi:small multidrug resistance family-3 protein
MITLTTPFIYISAAIAEIAGCFAFWIWLRQDKSILWLIPGIFCLLIFALLLTRSELAFAGRSYAAYGGIYIFLSLCWLWILEDVRPDQWDIIGGCFCLIGAAIILYGPRNLGS